MNAEIDVLIIGAGAAGLMCAIEAAKRGRITRVIDHANKAGKKILMSGGGRCNFTNYEVQAENYLSQNPHFCKSALSRFTQWDFLNLVNKHQIPFHEREHGELFCDRSSKDILNLLLAELRIAGGDVQLDTRVECVSKLGATGRDFLIRTDRGDLRCSSLVVASGGLSIPRMGATPFGYQLAEQFGIAIQPTRAGLVPFTLNSEDKRRLEVLSGIAIDSEVSNHRQRFRHNSLFTHRGLSGPAILQLSSYWRAGEPITIDFYPQGNVVDELKRLRGERPRAQLNSLLSNWLPKRVVATLFAAQPLSRTLANLSDQQILELAENLHQWQITPAGVEGYRTAEVTLGGVDCSELSSKTMESSRVRGLYFIGEVVDVTEWLGGYNFQWAWASGWCAGQFV